MLFRSKITSARFTPTLRDRVKLIDELHNCYDTPSKMYHWLKGAILSCAYIVPKTKLRNIRNETVFMIRNMIDPNTICLDSVRDTVEIIKRAKAVNRQFDNTASAMMTNWDIKQMEWDNFVPARLAEVDSDNSTNEGCNPFPDPPALLSKEAIIAQGIGRDPYGHVICIAHRSGYPDAVPEIGRAHV